MNARVLDSLSAVTIIGTMVLLNLNVRYREGALSTHAELVALNQ